MISTMNEVHVRASTRFGGRSMASAAAVDLKCLGSRVKN